MAKSVDLFHSYTPGKSHAEVFSKAFDSNHQVSLYPFDETEYKKALESWDFTNSKQDEVIINNAFADIKVFNDQLSCNFCQALIGYLNGELSFCIEIQREDKFRKPTANDKPYTVWWDFRINPEYEDRQEVMKLFVKVCREYVLQFSYIRRVQWNIDITNELFLTLALDCGFMLSDEVSLIEDDTEEQNKLHFIYTR